MRRKQVIFFCFLLCNFVGYANENINLDSIPVNAKKLIKSYDSFINGFADNYIVFKDGSKLVWDDGIRNKSHDELLNNPDLKDMFSQQYQAGMPDSLVYVNYEPGRIRNIPFFMKIYGSNLQEVKNNLTEIVWCPKLVGQKILVSKINGVDKALIQISNELDEHPELKKYVSQIGGTFKWRNIRGSQRQSMHSFGMTIDINTNFSNYWQWDCKCTDENVVLKYRNKIPQLIVDVFEKHGFIWGGKWYHYDTMHFEYRPELLK